MSNLFFQLHYIFVKFVLYLLSCSVNVKTNLQHMKTILYTLFAILSCLSTAWAQQEPSQTKADPMKKALSKQEMFKPEASSWKWDTITWYDSLDLKLYRRFQDFGSDGKLLVSTTQWGTSGAWVNLSRSSYTYDASGMPLTMLYENYESGAWVKFTRNTRVYDASGNLVAGLLELWQNNAWINASRFSCVFDASGRMLSEIDEIWKNNAWENSSKYVNDWDNNGNLLNSLYQAWNNGAWENYQQITYQYDTSGNMLEFLVSQWTLGAWVNVDKDTYTYDGNGQMLTLITHYWSANAWVNNTKYLFEWSLSGKLNVRTMEGWNMGSQSWATASRTIFNYDASGNRILQLVETWNEALYLWLADSRISYTYDVNRNSLSAVCENWLNGGWVPGNGFPDVVQEGSSIFSFGPAYRYSASFVLKSDGVKENSLAGGSLFLSPVPAVNSITVEYKDFKAGEGLRMTVYDSQGRTRIEMTLIQEKTELDISKLESGIYIARIVSAKGTSTARFTKKMK